MPAAITSTCGSIGTLPRTKVPRSRREVTSSSPPTASIRSRMLIKPLPRWTDLGLKPTPESRTWKLM